MRGQIELSVQKSNRVKTLEAKQGEMLRGQIGLSVERPNRVKY